MAFLPGLMKAAKGFQRTVAGKIINKAGGAFVSTLPGGKQLQAVGKSISKIISTPAGRATAIGIGGATVGGALVGFSGGGVPALPGAGGLPATMACAAAGGVLPAIIDSTMLGQYYRAPRGYVIVRDPQGNVFGMLRSYARQTGYWKPSRKPPISAGDWHKYQTAKSVEKRLLKIARHGLAKTHYTRKGRK